MDVGFNTLFESEHEPSPSAVANWEHAFVADPIHMFEIHLTGVVAGWSDLPPQICAYPFFRAIRALPEDPLMGQQTFSGHGEAGGFTVKPKLTLISLSISQFTCVRPPAFNAVDGGQG